MGEYVLCWISVTWQVSGIFVKYQEYLSGSPLIPGIATSMHINPDAMFSLWELESHASEALFWHYIFCRNYFEIILMMHILCDGKRVHFSLNEALDLEWGISLLECQTWRQERIEMNISLSFTSLARHRNFVSFFTLFLINCTHLHPFSQVSDTGMGRQHFSLHIQIKELIPEDLHKLEETFMQWSKT